jgi:hypothetical protein
MAFINFFPGKNPYDMRLNCKGGSDDLCYLETELVLDNPVISDSRY